MTNAYGVNSVDNSGLARRSGGSFLGGAGPELLMGLVSVFAGGGLFGGGSGGGIFGGLFGGGRGCENNYEDYGSYGRNNGRSYEGGYGSYGQNYDNDYGSERSSHGRGHSREYGSEYGGQRERGTSFGDVLMGALAGFGITRLVMGIISGLTGPKSAANSNHVNDVNQKTFVNNPNATDKFAQLNDWEARNIGGEKCPNLEIARPQYREIMDAYHAGGSKDKSKLTEALTMYKTDLTRLANDSIKPYDTDHDGVLNKKEFFAKSMEESRREAELLGVDFDAKAVNAATERAFKRLSHDGHSVTDKDLVTMYSLADMVSAGHKGLCKGNMDRLGYESVSADLGNEDVYKNNAGETITNKIAENIKGAYDFFFPKAAQ